MTSVIETGDEVSVFIAVMSAIICLGLAGSMLLWILTWTGIVKHKTRDQRGFEVKLNPGTTPGLIEKKEE